MTTVDSVLLISCYRDPLIINVAKTRSIRATTLRRNREVPLSIKLESNAALNLCEVLNVSREEALRIVEESADIVYMRSKNMVFVQDLGKDETAVEKETRETLAQAKRLEQAKLELARVEDRAERKRLADDERERRIQAAIDQTPPEPIETTLHASDSLSTGSTTGRQDATALSTEMSTLTVHVPPDQLLDEPLTAVPVMADVADNIPSTKWGKTRLEEYAKSRGINVNGMSKNKILQTLRNVK